MVGGQEHQEEGQQAEGQVLGRVAPPISMLKLSGPYPSLVDTVERQSGEMFTLILKC